MPGSVEPVKSIRMLEQSTRRQYKTVYKTVQSPHSFSSGVMKAAKITAGRLMQKKVMSKAFGLWPKKSRLEWPHMSTVFSPVNLMIGWTSLADSCM